jgi:hypothetical protein
MDLAEASRIARVQPHEGAEQGPRAPLKEALCQWSNLRRSLIALFGLVVGQKAVVLYTGQFYALFFLTPTPL